MTPPLPYRLVHLASALADPLFKGRLATFHILAASLGDAMIRNAFALNADIRQPAAGSRLWFECFRRHCVDAREELYLPSDARVQPSFAHVTFMLDKFHGHGVRAHSARPLSFPVQSFTVQEPEQLLIAAALLRPHSDALLAREAKDVSCHRGWFVRLMALGLCTGAMECKTALAEAKKTVDFCANTAPLDKKSLVAAMTKHGLRF